MSREARRISARAALALAAALAAGWAIGAWKAWTDPRTAWLGSRGSARWVVYPVPADTSVRPLVDLATSFRRTFPLEAAPAAAELRVRAFRRAVARVNGRDVALRVEGESWKSEQRAEVAELLRPGENLVEILVVNGSGPPALWAELRGPGLSIVSDARWDASLAGASWRRAALASDPPGGRRFDPVGLIPSTWDAVRMRWPTLLGFAALAMALSLALLRPWRLREEVPAADRQEGSASPWPLRAALVAASALWAVLLVNNSGALPLTLGFDAPQHLEYVQYIIDRKALPLADQGWQMFQPPLYYLLAALGLGIAGLDTASPGAAHVLRAIGLVIGVANLLIVGAFLRRMFPARASLQVAGMAVAALLPPMLYLHAFPTNEILGAAMGSAVLLATLPLLGPGRSSLGRHLLAGALLGLALLAKFSTLLLVPVVLGALALGAVRSPPAARRARLLGLALVPAAALVVCGWHFGRVWARFGDPFVGGWEARPGLGWWLDPGYRTVRHFLRFGRVLSDPLFAGFGGFWDALYSTTWGDGLFSGLTSTYPLPPWWSPSLHSAGYLLAIVPAACILAGFLVTVRSWIREPGPVEGLLLGTGLIVLVALGLMTLRVPSVAGDKAFYGLMALAPLATFAGRGLGALAGRDGWRRAVLLAGIATWAINSYATFLIDRSGPRARTARALSLVAGGEVGQGVALLRGSVAEHPEDWQLRVALARVLMESGGAAAEVEALLGPPGQGPERADRRLALALWASRRGDAATALAEVRRAVAIDPDQLEARELLAGELTAVFQVDPAIEAWREVVRIEPQNRAAHLALGRLYALRGQEGAAAMHRDYAARLPR